MPYNPNDLVDKFHAGLRDNRQHLNVSTEARFHDAIEKVLKESGVLAIREYRISPKDRFDLWLPGYNVVVEVKLKPRLVPLLQQLQRYAGYEQVHGLVLVTVTVPTGCPEAVGEKPLFAVGCWPYLLR